VACRGGFALALIGSERVSRPQSWSGVLSNWRQLKARFLAAEHAVVQRLAGTVFLIRVASALLAFGSQVLFARWIGSYEFGIYVYVWTWVLLIGQAIDLGLGTAAQRFIPEYREHGRFALLRGFVSGSRILAVGVAIGIAAIAAVGVRAMEPSLGEHLVIPLYLACVTFPAYALANVQEGISRSYDWIGLAMLPAYVVRQILLTLLMAGAYFAQLPMNAVTAMVVVAASVWGPTLAQLFIVNRQLSTRVQRGPKEYQFKVWLLTSLPILMVEGFYSLLAYADVLVLQHFRPPDDVAVYYATVKTLALVSFIYYSVSATTAHRFSTYHIAGDRDGLTAFIAQAIKWTFWPSLAAAALLLAFGRPILALFGAKFVEGYHLLFILVFGLLARAAIGPVERLLNMLGEQRICAFIYLSAFALNLGLCLLLIPPLGMAGAALSTAAALVFESTLLFTVTKNRLGFHVFIWGRRT
jgi:O-antigen/teichoic acid export membrane protein